MSALINPRLKVAFLSHMSLTNAANWTLKFQIYVASGHYAALGLKTAVESALLAQVQDELANEDLTTEELSAALAVRY